MTSRLRSHTETKIFLSLALFATVLLFIISPDSYTHDLYGRCDSAWFFMCGKAWMEGLTPYVDFADSKGPLLWLIYGIGYLISPRNYIGVFWLSCLWYAVIFYITYLTAKLFLSGRRLSVACSVLMALAFFNPMFHYETRAEDWAMLFLMASMYLTCKMLYTDEMDKRGINIAFFILGVCFAALVLIKYNIAAMQVVFILFALYHAIRHHHTIGSPLLFLLAGMVVVSIPFVAYLAHRGSLEAMMQEYFVNSYHTATANTSLLKDLSIEWGKVLTDKFRLPLFVILTAGSVLAYFKLDRYKLFPLVSTMFVFAISNVHAYWDFYFNSCAICCIWPAVYVLKHIKAIKPITAVSCVMVLLTASQLVIDKYIKHNMFWNDGWERKHFYNIEYWASQTAPPKVINAFFYEYGHGILSKSLPAAKYWSLQNGGSSSMLKEQMQYIRTQRPDVVFYNDSTTLYADPLFNGPSFIRSAGYPYCYEGHVYAKKELRQPSTPIHVSNWEVLTKQMPKALKQ